MAAHKATKSSSINEAILYTERTISCLDKLPQTEDIQKRVIDARTNLGLRFLEMNYFHEAEKAIEPIIELAQSHDSGRMVSRLFTILGTID